MSFTDIFTEEFLKGFNPDISIYMILVVLGVSLLMGLFIYFIYRYKNKNAFYNKDFNNTLVALPVITAAIVLSMQANIVVSLGMVGALSIVRFRNAVKSSMDLMYLFWSISVGIINGAQVYLLSTILTVLMVIIIMGMDLINVPNNGVLVVVTLKQSGINGVVDLLKSYDANVVVRSEAKVGNKYQCIYELNTKKRDDLTKELSNNKNITSLNILLNDGANRLV